MIEKNYNESLLKKEPAAVSLLQKIFEIDQEKNLDDSGVYHQFPFYRDTTGDSLITANILFASKKYGIIIFQCIQIDKRESDTLESFDDKFENLNILDTLIFSRLVKSELLKKGRRELKLSITPIIFVNGQLPKIETDFNIVTEKHEVEKLILGNNPNPELTSQEFAELKSLLEGSKVIPKKNERIIQKKDDVNTSKGAILSKIENEIAIFDSEQKRAALFTLDSPQRIRGLAGSGKTIILAMKAALIHLQDENAHILYTYYTKALNDYVKKLITRFYRMFSERDPNWDKIHIMHAWGGKGLEGVYYNAAIYNSIPPMNLREAKFKTTNDPFAYICSELIKSDLKYQYDYSLLDEAQDFPKSFYQLCRQITVKNRIIWAYDDFQNILDIEIQNEKQTFGKDLQGNYYIDFSKKDEVLQDLVLHKCYRNPRKNLIAAFSLGLGIYNDNNKVLQRLENNQHWESLGFKIEEGKSETGDLMVISRPLENSPLLKNELLDDDIFKISSFSSLREECEEVVKLIAADIENELLPEDIAVIALDNKHVKTYFEVIEELLEKKNIKTFSLIDAPSDNITYKVQGHVTLSTIYKAKGNESGSVYVVGIDAIFLNKNSIVERNKLFTAITRSEAWVTLTGMKPLADLCIEEYKKLKDADFKLIFKQPSKESTKTIYQEISRQQEKLNQMEKIAEDLKKLGLTEKELKERLLNLVFAKK